MRSTANLVASHVTGSTLPAAQVNDVSTVLSGVDDDTLYDLTRLDPPAGASETNVNTGYLPLYDGILVEGDAVARQVTIKPLRVIRSSTSNATPRAILSAVSSADVVKALPADPGAGLWGMELLYAQISYVDASNPTKGAQVSFLWASPAYTSTANPPNFGALPANTTSPPTWNVPLRWVKNVNGATTTPQEYIVHAPYTQSVNQRGRIRGALGGLHARRAFSVAQFVELLVSGSGGAFASGTQILTPTITPTMAPSGDPEFELVPIKIPAEFTDGTAGADETITVDELRDWRNADFLSCWSIPNATGEYFGEEDTTTGASNSRQHPRSHAGSPRPALAWVSGQSFEPDGGAGDLVAAKIIRDSYTYANGGTTYLGNAADSLALIVDSSTGALQFKRNIAGAIAGAPITIWLLAMWPNKR